MPAPLPPPRYFVLYSSIPAPDLLLRLTSYYYRSRPSALLFFVAAVTLDTTIQMMARLTDETNWNKDIRSFIQDRFDKLLSSLRQSNQANTDELKRIEEHFHEQMAGIKEVVDTTKVKDILLWLAWPGYSSKIKQLVDDCGSTTCHWFVEGKEFKSFAKAEMKCLLIYGQAGCGKSTLMTAAMHHLRWRAYSEGPDQLILAHFFDKTDATMRDSSSLLRSLLSRLLELHQADAIVHLADAQKRTALSNATRDEMKHALHAILALITSPIFILVDALDEAQDEAVEYIFELCDVCPSISLLVSSRTAMSVENLIQSRVSMDDNRANTDIQTFVRAALDTGALKALKGSPFKEEVYSKLVNGATGNFRWAALVIEWLKDSASFPLLLLQRLEKMPKSLEELYGAQLGCMSQDFQAHARRLLMWLVYSERPITREDFATLSAMIHTAAGPIYQPEYRPDPDHALTLIDTMFITTSQNIVRFAHASVQEYLLKLDSKSPFHLRGAEDYALMARMCLSYIANSEYSAGDVRTFCYNSAFPTTWVRYVDRAGSDHYGKLELDIMATLESIQDKSGSWDIICHALSAAVQRS